MRKLLAILSVLTWMIPLFWQPLWGQTPTIGVNAPKKKPDNAAGSTNATEPRGTKENPLIVDALGHQETPVERKKAEEQAAEAKAEEQYHRDIDRWMLVWTGITAVATAVLVIVGLGAVRAALRTLSTMRTQENLMKRQADLMETQAALMERQTNIMAAPFDQWVELSNWRVEKPSGNRLRVEVDLVNPSTFPITLNDSYIQFDSFIDRATYVKYGTGDMAFLPPNNPTPIVISVPVSDAEQNAIAVSFPVTAVFSHFHRITKAQVVQKLVGRLDCGQVGNQAIWEAKFTTFVGMNPQIQETKNDSGQKAN